MWSTLFACLVVGALWGSTNALLRYVNQHASETATGSTNQAEDQKPQRLSGELRRALSNPQWLVVFALNQCGSVAFYALLGSSDLSVAVPATQAATLVFTALTGRLLGEGRAQGLAGARAAGGLALIAAGGALIAYRP